jgi:hypothetical protein
MNAAPNAVVRAPQGHLVVPVCNSVLGQDGKLFSPFGYVWLEVLILIGHWKPDGRCSGSAYVDRLGLQS